MRLSLFAVISWPISLQAFCRSVLAVDSDIGNEYHIKDPRLTPERMNEIAVIQYSGYRMGLWRILQGPSGTNGLCGLTVERSLAVQKVEGSNLGRSSSR